MATKTIKTQIGLRRDTEANYEWVKDTLIPVKGEVCMVDTNKGLKFKVGDGTSTFAQLDFIEPNTSGAGGTNVEANPELTGNEEKLNSITIDGTNYDIPSGAEAYVEEHQTLVINNNGTGGSSNNNTVPIINYANYDSLMEFVVEDDETNKLSGNFIAREEIDKLAKLSKAKGLYVRVLQENREECVFYVPLVQLLEITSTYEYPHSMGYATYYKWGVRYNISIEARYDDYARGYMEITREKNNFEYNGSYTIYFYVI